MTKKISEEDAKRLSMAELCKFLLDGGAISTHTPATYWHHDEDFGVFMETVMQPVEDVDGNT